MSGLIGKLAPTAIVAAVVTWCCWPYLSGAAGDGGFQEPSDVAEIADSLLSPAIEPAPGRNPFQPAHANQTASTEIESTQVEEPPTKVAEKEEVAPQVDIRAMLKSLVLGGIVIHGDRRFALINNKLHGEGESLVLSGAAAEPCIVVEISAHKVVVQHQGQTFELKYREPASGAGPSELVETNDQAVQGDSKRVLQQSNVL